MPIHLDSDVTICEVMCAVFKDNFARIDAGQAILLVAETFLGPQHVLFVNKQFGGRMELCR
jgi:hypothetical protein